MTFNLAAVRLSPSSTLNKGALPTPVAKGDAWQGKRIADLERAVRNHEVLLARLVARVNRIDGAGGAEEQPSTPGVSGFKRIAANQQLRKDVRPVRDSNGGVNEAATLIKGIHKRGAR